MSNQVECEKEGAESGGLRSISTPAPAASFGAANSEQTSSTFPLERIGPYYLEIFKRIEAGNGPKFNVYAFLGGFTIVPIWYFYKGMWQKGLTYLALFAVFGVILHYVFGRALILSGGLAVSLGYVANWDYYLYLVHDEKWFTWHWISWNPWPKNLSRRLS